MCHNRNRTQKFPSAKNYWTTFIIKVFFLLVSRGSFSLCLFYKAYSIICQYDLSKFISLTFQRLWCTQLYGHSRQGGCGVCQGIFFCGPPSSPTCTHWGQDKKSLREPCAEVQLRPPKQSSKQFTKKNCCLQNSIFCPQAYRSGSCRRIAPLDGAIDTTFYSILVSFFFYYQEAAEV